MDPATRSSLKEDGIQIRDNLVRATKGIGAISRRTSAKSFYGVKCVKCG